MLGNRLNQARKAVESLYDCTCIVSRYQKNKDSTTKETKILISIIYSGISCRVSRSRLSENTQTDTVNKVLYKLKLIITTDIEIIQGDTIEVTNNKFGTSEKYLAGEGFKYSTHQEIILIKDGKA